MEDSKGELVFLARTCVLNFAQDSCIAGLKEGLAVTVCNNYCMEEGCNGSSCPTNHLQRVILTIILQLFRGY